MIGWILRGGEADVADVAHTLLPLLLFSNCAAVGATTALNSKRMLRLANHFFGPITFNLELFLYVHGLCLNF